jgi:hypothetical protein
MTKKALSPVNSDRKGPARTTDFLQESSEVIIERRVHAEYASGFHSRARALSLIS